MHWTNWLVRVLYVRYVIAIVVDLGTRQAGQDRTGIRKKKYSTYYIHTSVPTYLLRPIAGRGDDIVVYIPTPLLHLPS